MKLGANKVLPIEFRFRMMRRMTTLFYIYILMRTQKINPWLWSNLLTCTLAYNNKSICSNEAVKCFYYFFTLCCVNMFEKHQFRSSRQIYEHNKIVFYINWVLRMLERYIDQTQTVSLVIKADMFQSLMFLYQQENLLNFFQNIT